ncbi:hypothetical protein [Halalkalibacillus halophilus]|uniref:hypothetical protein n=1 Tax=Halalkalibacillus halophilus TaxID=392827 RepID=UPI000480C98A|nr:hypothetical protein [Halalkalibacillus halophilus]
MIYTSQLSQSIKVFLSVLIIGYLVVLFLSPSLNPISYLLILLIIISLSSKREIIFDHSNKRFSNKLFLGWVPVYQKWIQYEEIEKVSCKRIRWKTKYMKIHVKSGWNVPLGDFTKKEFFEEWERLAEDRNIPVEKSKDYQVLEKLN